MRHVISIVLIVGAFLAGSTGWGPLYFGAPVIGMALLLAALGLEVLFWRRVVRERR